MIYELYNFTAGSKNYYYTNNAGGDVTYEGNVYSALTIERSDVIYSEPTKDLNVILPYNTEPIYSFLDDSVAERVWVTIYQFNDDITITVFVGNVSQIIFQSDKIVSLKCTSAENSLKSKMPIPVYQASCRHILYSTICGASKDASKVTITYNGSNITLSDDRKSYTSSSLNVYRPGTGEKRNYLWGNIEIYRNGNLIETLFITQQVDDVVTVTTTTPRTNDLLSGDVVVFLEGCNKTLDRCYKINDSERFGGFPYIPFDSPFSGSA